MNLREYQYVLKVAQLQNMTRAAEALYITQPSLSHYIARVEEELGVQLFNRLTTPLSLTPAGEKYVETAQMILELASGLKKDYPGHVPCPGILFPALFSAGFSPEASFQNMYHISEKCFLHPL